jgi:hypothetical protein
MINPSVKTPRRLSRSVLVALVVTACSACAPSNTRDPVNFANARMEPGHAPVVIDGERSSPDEWKGAVVVPLSTDGHVEFLWSDDGVFMYLSGARALADVETICVDMFTRTSADDDNRVRLDMKMKTNRPCGSHPLSMMVLESITKSTAGQTETIHSPFDPKLAKFAAGPTHYGLFGACLYPTVTSWAAEAFVPWTAVGCQGPPSGAVSVYAYRLEVERPVSVLMLNSVNSGRFRGDW